MGTSQENYEFHKMMKQNKKAERVTKRAHDAQMHSDAIADLTFHGWPKIARLNRDIVITEKIDGTNAAIGIIESIGAPLRYTIYAQSRTRLLSLYDDNMGFAAWVEQHRDLLVKTLGPGLHFGEWFGQGIQRGYGLTEKRFALFNTARWNDGEGALALANARLNECAIYCVPVLYQGPWFSQNMPGGPPVYRPEECVSNLHVFGSVAVPGFRPAEGIVVFHRASGTLLKATLENDEKPKNSQEVS